MLSSSQIRGTIAALVLLAVGASPGVADAGEHHGGGHDGGHGGGHGSGEGPSRHRNAPTVPGAREIQVRAKSFEFTPDEITLAAGEDVTIALRSTDVLHDFVVKGEGHVVSAKAKKTKRGGIRVDEPGTYRFWCSVPGHRSAGMRGTIVVQ
jgi:plastocyanin